ncbi:MAG: hypothetical protein HYV14_12855 [Elusimicrobia bacterium]|nr:hypothetical protein [Elusimicrobiota bacterium]
MNNVFLPSSAGRTIGLTSRRPRLVGLLKPPLVSPCVTRIASKHRYEAMITALLIANLLLVTAYAAEKREFYGPALEDYKATEKDFLMLEAAIAGALQTEARLFPGGITGVDVIMQDTSDFYIYSRNLSYPYPKIKRWRKYQVYRLPHRRPQEHEMWGCAGGPPSVMEVDDRRIVAEYSIRCAPWGSFRRAQTRKRSYYRFEQAYLATMIHEYGHQYEEQKRLDPTPLMASVQSLSRSAAVPKEVERESMQREAFAQACELIGAKERYPDHYRRMVADAKGRSPSKTDGHREALVLAVDMLEKGTALEPER